MKLRFVILILIVLVQKSLSAQNIPNGNFENWDINANRVACPAEWDTHNEPELIFIESSTGHSGNYAVCLNVVWDYMLKKYCGANLSINFTNKENQQYKSLEGFLKGNPENSDSLCIQVSLLNNDGVIGSGSLTLLNNYNDWIEFKIPLFYVNNAVPERISISVTIKPEKGGYHMTTYCLDDLLLTENKNEHLNPSVFRKLKVKNNRNS